MFVKTRIKTVTGRLLYGSGAHRRRWSRRALIALFHRIDDRYPADPITVTAKAFATYLDFFSSHFDVISLHELLDRIARRADISRALVITFDDGYRDNWSVAAPQLQRRRLPACFFVATGFVGTRRQAWWDVERGTPSEWMTWDHVRELHRAGFEVGAHTVSHINLAAADGPTAWREVTDSKAHIESEIGGPVRHFAYPFGGVEHLRANQRGMIKDAGFLSCVSAHGGSVRLGDDPFALRRLGISSSWFRSPYHFGFECLADRTTRNSAEPASAAMEAHSATPGFQS